MWSTTTMFHSDDSTNHVVEHNCDSTHGQSGSPMWTADNNVSNLTYDRSATYCDVLQCPAPSQVKPTAELGKGLSDT